MKMSQTGFTLLEVMLASLLASIVIMGTASLYVSFAKQQNRQLRLLQMFSETKLVIDQFQLMVEGSAKAGAATPVISNGKKKFTADSKSLRTSGSNIILTTTNGTDVILAEDCGVLFGYTSSNDTYTVTLMRGDNGQVFETEIRRIW